VVDDCTRPRSPGATWLSGITLVSPSGAPTPAIEVWAPRRKHHWQYRNRRDHRYDGNEQAAIAEASQEWHGQEDQREKANADGDATKGHGSPGSGHSNNHRFVIRSTAISFLAPASYDEQGIVNRNAETDQGDEVLDKLTDVGERSDGPDEQERGENGYPGKDDRDKSENDPNTSMRTRSAPIAPRTTSPSTPIPPLPGAS